MLLARRLPEFSLVQIVDILHAAAKPAVGKKLVVRALAGFANQAVDLVEKVGKQHPTYLPSVERLRAVIPVVFEKAELQKTLLDRLDEVTGPINDTQ
jgi:hypothetical protein